MDAFFDILKLILPALIVFLTTFYMLKRFLEREESHKVLDLRKANQEKTLPLRLQAYERLSLFLERIALNNLLMRVVKDDMNAQSLRTALLKAIREEYEHNLTQQIYVSDHVWEHVRHSKEEMIKFINTGAEKIGKDASAYDLSKHLFDIASQVKKMPTTTALQELKKEVRKLF